jgi:hypothetical protein
MGAAKDSSWYCTAMKGIISEGCRCCAPYALALLRS